MLAREGRELVSSQFVFPKKVREELERIAHEKDGEVEAEQLSEDES